MRKILVGLIIFYQKTLSFETGLMSVFASGRRTCRFFPTCSEYTKQAIERFGCFEGSLLGIKRILRCHPWNVGGVDEVPKKVKSKK